MMARLDDLRERQKALILGTCNKFGCKNCGLKWYEDGERHCSSGELEGEIYELEIKELKSNGVI